MKLEQEVNHPMNKGGEPVSRVVHIVPDSSVCSDEEDDDASFDSTYYSDSTSDDFSSDDDGEEGIIVKRLVEHMFSCKRTLASAFSSYEQQPQSRCKKPRWNVHVHARTAPARYVSEVLFSYTNRMITSASSPNLLLKDSAPTTSAASSLSHQPNSSVETISPQDYLRCMHEKSGVTFKTVLAHETNDFFVPCTGAYDMIMVQAVRTKDLQLLQKLHDKGRSLQSGNKFGESTVHTASRHGAVAVVELLLELGVSVRVCCDAGRTPLHDACWTVTPPNMDMVDVLLDACPDLLYICDKRGVAPLAYVPREHWGAWCNYLDRRGLDHLLAKQVV